MTPAAAFGQGRQLRRLLADRRRNILLVVVGTSVLLAASVVVATPIIAGLLWIGIAILVLAITVPRLAFFGLLSITPLDLHLQSTFLVNAVLYPAHFVVAAFVLARIRPNRTAVWTRDRWLIAAYAIVVVASLAYAFLDASLGVPYDSLRFAYELGSYLALAVAGARVITNTKDLMTLYTILLLSLLATDIYAIYQGLVHDYGAVYRWLYPLSSDLPWRDRPPGLLNGPNNQSAYINIILPIVIAMGLYRRSRFTVVGAVVALSLSLDALFLTQSRGAWVAAALMLMLLVAASVPWLLRTPVVIGAITATVATALIVPGISERLQDYDASLYSRLDLWNLFGSLFISHPLLGVGFGSFGVYYARAMGIVVQPGTPLLHAHDIYLQLLAETGVLGFTIVVSLMVRSSFRAWQAYRLATARGNATVAAFFIGTAIAIVGFLVHGLVDVVWYSSQFATVLWVLVILCSYSATFAGPVSPHGTLRGGPMPSVHESKALRRSR